MVNRVYGGEVPVLNLFVYFSINNCLEKIKKKHSVENVLMYI